MWCDYFLVCTDGVATHFQAVTWLILWGILFVGMSFYLTLREPLKWGETPTPLPTLIVGACIAAMVGAVFLWILASIMFTQGVLVLSVLGIVILATISAIIGRRIKRKQS